MMLVPWGWRVGVGVGCCCGAAGQPQHLMSASMGKRELRAMHKAHMRLRPWAAEMPRISAAILSRSSSRTWPLGYVSPAERRK